MTEAKGWQGNFFEDFQPGMHLACPAPRRLGEGEAAAYIALTGDRTPRFCGAAAPVHPLVVFHTVMGQTVRQVSLNARANLGYAEMIWGAPVEMGSVVRTGIEIIGLKENSNRKTGIVWLRTTGRTEEGECVLSYVRWVMVKKRGEAPTRFLDQPVVPTDLPAAVSPERLFVDPKVELPEPTDTGGRYWFEDYARGERVFHHDGQTVNPSDHMSFTRLFQNSAKVHFDAARMDGRPLVYGGYPISIGYAQAHNGFENRLGLAAVNAGSHANPVYAGDTLYAFTEVADVADLGPRVGALRLSLYVVKNRNPADRPDMEVKVDGGRHHPDVVLDLDFWELMPKRPA